MGYIIVIEGTDGSGKQTQTNKLYERLKAEGHNLIRQSFPNYDSPSSSGVKMYLAGELCERADQLDAYQASVLYSVDRLCTYQKDLKKHYEAGGIILCDRYVESNILHQACKIHDLNKKDEYLDWLCNLEYNLLKLPRADKVIFLDMPPEVSRRLASERGELKAGTKQDIHEKDAHHIMDAYNNGKYVAKKYGWNVIKCVDGDRLKSIDEIHEEIVKIVTLNKQ